MISWTDADAKTLVTGNKTSIGVSLELFWSLAGISLNVMGLIFWHKAVLKPVIVLGGKETALANKLTKASETCDPNKTRTPNQGYL